MSVAVELNKKEFKNIDDVVKFTCESLDYLVTSRPTAVNMADAALKFKNVCSSLKDKHKQVNDFKEEYF